MTASRLPSTRETGLLHPVALLAVALLLLNDHVFKERYPGWITGKLSDVAGMIFFPLFLRAVIEEALGALRRPAPSTSARDRTLMGCVAATVLVFTGVKLWAPAATAYAIGLGALQWPFVAGLQLLKSRPIEGLHRVDVVMDTSDLLAIPFVGVALWVGLSARSTGARPEDPRKTCR